MLMQHLSCSPSSLSCAASKCTSAAFGVDGTAGRLVAYTLLSAWRIQKEGWQGAAAACYAPCNALSFHVTHSVHMQDLLAEKDAELRQLAQRIERMEARRGAIDELQQLDALEAQLKVS